MLGGMDAWWHQIPGAFRCPVGLDAGRDQMLGGIRCPVR